MGEPQLLAPPSFIVYERHARTVGCAVSRSTGSRAKAIQRGVNQDAQGSVNLSRSTRPDGHSGGYRVGSADRQVQSRCRADPRLQAHREHLRRRRGSRSGIPDRRPRILRRSRAAQAHQRRSAERREDPHEGLHDLRSQTAATPTRTLAHLTPVPSERSSAQSSLAATARKPANKARSRAAKLRPA